MAESGKVPELLYAMGRDVGSVHAAHRRAGLALEHLHRRPQNWLLETAERAAALVRADYSQWNSAKRVST